MSQWPTSLREAIAYLTLQPYVIMTTRYAKIECHSFWAFSGLKSGCLWFRPARNPHPWQRTGLSIAPSHGWETGLEFDANGFDYEQGRIKIRVTYIDPCMVSDVSGDVRHPL